MEKAEFELIKNTVNNIGIAKKSFMTMDMSENRLPHIFGLKLTNRCNLRCKHCYEWNKDGYHNRLNDEDKNDDLDFDIILKCIEETKDIHPSFYLWGGEPLIYNRIADLLQILADRDAIVAICTNGHALMKYIDILKKFSNNLELVIALEGDEKSNDALRGKGSYQKTIGAIKELAELKKKGEFHGKITVHTMISNDNLDDMVPYLEHMEDIGVENLMLCYPWYISDDVSDDMDRYFEKNFSWLYNEKNMNINSWHAFKYHIQKENYEKLLSMMKEIKKQKWEMNLKIQPKIKDESVCDFLDGENILKNEDCQCLSVYSRMDILPSGKVTTCKHFPEFTIGDLNKQSVSEIWCSEEMNKVRMTFRRERAPICSKCNNLYLHGYKSKVRETANEI